MYNLEEIDTGAEFYIIGEAEIQAPEMDYFNGTGIRGGAAAYVYGLAIEINGKRYEIPAANMPPELVQHLTEACETEIEKEIF